MTQHAVVPVGPQGVPAPLPYGGQGARLGLSGGPMAELLLGLVRDPETGRLRKTDFFVFSWTWTPLLANATESRTVQIQNDSDFLMVALSGIVRSTAAGAAAQAAAATLVLESSGSGRNVFDRAQDWDAIVGTAQRPAWLPAPKFLDRASALQATLADIGGIDRTIRLAAWGIKVFDSTMGV